MSDLSDYRKTPRLKPKPPEDIALALSGGGHRAALFGLGVLLGLVDRGLNKHVKQITSVSGGSIVNAFVATHCKFDDPQLTNERFDEVAARLVKIIVHKGVLTWGTIAVFLFILLVPPPLFIWLAWNNMFAWWLAAPLAVGWLCMALLRGLVIEWMIEARYFFPRLELSLFPPNIRMLRKKLCELHDHPEHVLACTDLLQPGAPYFSSQRLREEFIPGTFYSPVSGHPNIPWMSRSASSVLIASAVRASAAFPGIPPRLIQFKSSFANVEFPGKWTITDRSDFDSVPDLEKAFLLADGGVWNNLGTHILRELDWDPLRYGPMVLIAADASVPLKTECVIRYCIPIYALSRSLVRIANISHVNTVEPRIDQMQRRSAEREFGGTIAEPQLDAITKELRLTTAQTETLTELNRSGYLSKEGPWDIPIRLTVPPNERLGWYLGKISNVPSSEQWIGAVRDVSGCGAELFKLAAIDVSKIGTHLRRIRKEDAIGLLARGYLHAFLSTVELRPLEAKEVKQLEKVPQRLRNIAK